MTVSPPLPNTNQVLSPTHSLIHPPTCSSLQISKMPIQALHAHYIENGNQFILVQTWLQALAAPIIFLTNLDGGEKDHLTCSLSRDMSGLIKFVNILVQNGQNP